MNSGLSALVAEEGVGGTSSDDGTSNVAVV